MTIADALVDWFAQQARSLPWRTEPRDAYRTLVSEIMLQQTQADRVAPRYVEFVQRFPDLKALAAASEDDVLALWSGLGYYRRARLLHRLACEVIRSGRDRLPEGIEALRALPGVGDYTAAAVGSLAFGLEEPALDGNVRRVVARVEVSDQDPKTSGAQTRMKIWVRRLFQGHHPGVVNEALMELGATVCTPSVPRCGACPLARWCEGHKAGRPEEYPRPRKTRSTERLWWVAACFVGTDGRWLLRRIQDGPILRGLWLPPLADLEPNADPISVAISLAPEGLRPARGTVFGSVCHHITHRRIEVVPVLARIFHELPTSAGDALTSGLDVDLSAAVWQWARPGEQAGGTSSLFEKLYKVIDCNEKDDETLT